LDVRSITLQAPNQVGIDRSVAVSPNTRAQKFVNPDGSQIIVLVIKSPGASGIGVHFRDFALADGEEVYVYGTATDSIVFGPFTNNGPSDSGEFWSGTIDGDTIVIEFYKRTDENGKGFEIFEISHMFTELDWRLRSNEPEVLSCERDASCYNNIEKNAVGRILFRKNGLWFVCTGTLLNDFAEDECPYFLTANHCVDSQAVAQTVEVYWFYQTRSCDSLFLRDSVHFVGGATLLRKGISDDFSLLRLPRNHVPAGAVFSGWTSVAQSIGTSVFGLHHPDRFCPPDGDSFLRRSNGTIRTPLTPPNGSCLLNSYEIRWTAGLTEHGSSGSGLFTSNGHQLVGVLSCSFRPDRCPTPQDVAWDNYSKFANFFSQIRPYIYSGTPGPPVANAATLVTTNSFRANWASACSAASYRLDVSTSSSFSSYVTGYHNLNVGNATSRSVTALNAGTTYYYRVRAYNANGASGNSNVIHVTTHSQTGTPTPTPNPTATPTPSGFTYCINEWHWIYPPGYWNTDLWYGSNTPGRYPFPGSPECDVYPYIGCIVTYTYNCGSCNPCPNPCGPICSH
jgi:Trypsin-like peptidase domain